MSNIKCRKEHLAAVTLPLFELHLKYDMHLQSLSPMLIPGLALTLKHSDFFMNQQLKAFLDRYYYMLDNLKGNYRQTLRVTREFERSIQDNEDGFFL